MTTKESTPECTDESKPASSGRVHWAIVLSALPGQASWQGCLIDESGETLAQTRELKTREQVSAAIRSAIALAHIDDAYVRLGHPDQASFMLKAPSGVVLLRGVPQPSLLRREQVLGRTKALARAPIVG